jgi:hypothetical protein
MTFFILECHPSTWLLVMLIEVVPVNGWKVSIDPGGSEVVINSWDVWGILLDGKPGCSGIRQWTKCHAPMVRMPSNHHWGCGIQQLTLELEFS